MSRFCFTINNPTGALNLDHLPDCVNYCIYQEEVGKEGTHHFQGYIETSSRMRYTTLIAKLDWDAGHWEVAKGSPDSCIRYCSKADTKVDGPWSVGTVRPHAPGKRVDLEEVKRLIEGGSSDMELFASFPHVMAQYRRFVSEYRTLWNESQLPKEAFVPRIGWQTELAGTLSCPPHPRKVIWVYETTGNVGKSYFARNYRAEDTYIVSGGKHADIYYAYGLQGHVFFDMPRSMEDHFPYEVLEKFKDGLIFKAKYESKVVRFKVPHVVVFANFAPDLCKLSMDRWDVRNVLEI